MGLRNVFLISKEFCVNLFVCSFPVFSDKCLFFASVLICLVFFSFLLNKLFPLSALVLPAKQAVLKSSFQKIRHQSPYHIYMLFLVPVFKSKHPSSACATRAAERNAKPLVRASHAFLSALAELFRLGETKKREKGGPS